MTASIVVIGAGTIGELHANVVREHPAARLSAIVDTDLDRATEVATRHDVTATDEPRPELATADGCIIATPEPTHARLTDLSLSRDCATLLEKPIAHDLDHAKRVHEAAAASEHSVLLGHLLRFDPRYSTIKDRLDAGDLGELISMSARRGIPIEWSRRMGDRVHPVVQVTTHDFDLLRWYAEGEIVEVRAVETSQRLAEFDVPDVVQTVVRFSSGTIATIETHGVWPSGFPEEISARLEVTGTDGGARATAPEGGLEIATDGCAVVETGHWPRIHGKVDGTLRRQFDHFLSVLDGETPRISTGDALRTAVVTDAVVRSLDSGAPIEL